jgi:hypothetical protein
LARAGIRLVRGNLRDDISAVFHCQASGGDHFKHSANAQAIGKGTIRLEREEAVGFGMDLEHVEVINRTGQIQ